MVSPQSAPSKLGTPRQILGVILGAARFPNLSVDSPKLGRAFSRSKAAVDEYLREFCDEVLDYFDTRMLPNQLCLKIDSFLKARPLGTDLFVYYVGHGGFLSRREYFLACRATREDNKSATGLRMDDLADTITEAFRNRRVYIVIDCCFASSSVDSFQGAQDDLIARHAERLPYGIALLNASSRDDVALAPDGAFGTMFSDSLMSVLRNGVPGRERLLSLRDIGTAVTDLILTTYRETAVKPEIHSPKQKNGDVADFRLFPNPAFIEKVNEKPQKDRKSRVKKTVTVRQLATLYQFPPNLDGSDQCIGIVHLGSMPDMSGLRTYCKSELGLAPPQVTVLAVSGGAVKPGSGNYGEDHLMVSMQVCCGVAAAARQIIYVAPNTNDGYIAAIKAAANDEENKPCALLVSWGSIESSWEAETMAATNDAILAATKRGITVCCAAGNNGATCGARDNRPHVIFPASSPYALACGCTALKFHDDQRVDEVAWDQGGGGFSEVFPAPSWQVETLVEQPSCNSRTGRGVPDVSAHAGLDHAVRVYLRENWNFIGGSTVANALWAGLIALINQGVGQRIAFTPELFHRHFGPAGTLNDIVSGRNGEDPRHSYSAGPGWDPCTGWGTPNGTALLLATKLYLSLITTTGRQA
jgi:hypothetical protein